MIHQTQIRAESRDTAACWPSRMIICNAASADASPQIPLSAAAFYLACDFSEFLPSRKFIKMLRPAWWPMSRLLSLSLSRYSSRALQCRTAIVVPSAVEDKDQASSWQQLQLAPALCSRLQQAGYARPNSLQAQWLPQLMQATGQPLVLGAETGTGKTLCRFMAQRLCLALG